MSKINNARNSRNEEKISYDDFDIFYFNDDVYLDLVENNEDELIYPRINDENAKSNTRSIVGSSNNQSKNIIANKQKYLNRKKRNRRSSNLSILKYNFNFNNTIKVDYKGFIEYLNIKINGDKYKNVLKESLIILHNQLQLHLQIKPLTREEKRDKNKILIKLFSISSEVINCIQTKPDVLHPSLIQIGAKIKDKKERMCKKKKKITEELKSL